MRPKVTLLSLCLWLPEKTTTHQPVYRLKILLLLLLASSLFAAAQASVQTIEPEDTGEVLLNPGMGWTMHFYSNYARHYGSKMEPSDVLDDFPGVSTVYLRVPWAYLEPKEGEYNWALFDTPAQRFIAAGKKVALRVTTSENWMPFATPEWVKDAGAEGLWYDLGKGPHAEGESWDPDFSDPVYLKYLNRLLAAMGERYDGNPDIEFIDIGTYGMWGEGHTHMSSMPSREKKLHDVKLHIDLHLKYFPNTLLVISDDVVGSTKPGRTFPISEYARERGVTLRDDSILVSPAPNAWYHEEMISVFWPDRPIILEHQHYGSSVARGAWDPDLLVESVEAHHASYMSIHWWPHRFLQANREAIDAMNQRMGYRLQLRAMSWPASITRGKPFEVESVWANAGVAPVYQGGFMALTLKDAAGGIVAVLSDESLNMRDLEVGPKDAIPTTRHTSRLMAGYMAPTTRPGTYDLFVSVGRRDGTPVIALPLEGDDGERRYKIGRITIEAEDYEGQYYPPEPIEEKHQVPHDRPSANPPQPL